MSGEQKLTGPDLTLGVPLSQVADGGMLAGHAFGKPVVVVRRGTELFAVSGVCTHYSGPLGEGIVAGDTIRCPWHHACFSLRTGEAVRAPALNPLPRFEVERRGDTIVVTRESPAPAPRRRPQRSPRSVVIVGAGAAGDAAADMLRREGYEGPISLVGEDRDAPYDRPNISKDYLAGNAPEDWIPLRPKTFYQDHGIELLTGKRVTRIDTATKTVALDDGSSRSYDALLLATGASPVRLPLSVDPDGRVMYLRTLADSRAIIARLETAKTAVVVGASFIGLEVAASLRARKLDVHVVAPEERPLERVLGRELGDLVRAVHESNGVRFHLGRTTARVDGTRIVLDDGTELVADLVVAGIGVRPNEALAADAGLAVAKGVRVNEYLETGAPGIFAAGDVARYPDFITGKDVRIEHWAVAQRQGQVAARNILGARQRFDAAPFFWSAHFDMTIGYVGHAEEWDDVAIDGRVEDRDCAVSYRLRGRTLAVATVGRDLESLRAEVALEQAGAA